LLNAERAAYVTSYALEAESNQYALKPEFSPLSIIVTANPSVIQSGQTSTITVRVTDGTYPIADGTVALSSDKGGTFSPTSGYTNSSGYLTSTYAESSSADLNSLGF